MRKYLNIFSVMMLIVYGALTFVAVPLHHHSQEDVESFHHSTPHQSHDCGVCSFVSTAFTVEQNLFSVALLEFAAKIYFADYQNELASIFSKEYPRRGPPSYLS